MTIISDKFFFYFHPMFSVAENTCDLMQSVLFYQLVICVLFIAFSLFSLDQSMHEINFNTFLSTIAVLVALTPTFIYCYYADGVTADLHRVGDIFYQLLWYKLTNQEQKLLILPMQRAQQIFRMKGYGIVDCSLQIFLTVNAFN